MNIFLWGLEGSAFTVTGALCLMGAASSSRRAAASLAAPSWPARKDAKIRLEVAPLCP